MNDIQAIILAGGLGTRLKDLYPDKPKCLVPVAGKPFLHWQLDWLRRHGVTRAHIAAGHLGEQTIDRLPSIAPPSIHCTGSIEPEPLGTGGGLRYCLPWMEKDYLCVMNGDTIVPQLDLTAMCHAMRTGSWNASIAITVQEHTGTKGSILLKNERVAAFQEKTDDKTAWVNAGVYLITKTQVAEMAEQKVISLERDWFPSLAERNLLHAFPCTSVHFDMGTPEGLETMAEFLTKPSDP